MALYKELCSKNFLEHGEPRYGNRMQKGAKGWDAASPRHFHHKQAGADPWPRPVQALRNLLKEPVASQGSQLGEYKPSAAIPD